MKLGQLRNNFPSRQKIRLAEYGKTIFKGVCDECEGFDDMTVGLIEFDPEDRTCIKINIYKRYAKKEKSS